MAARQPARRPALPSLFQGAEGYGVTRVFDGWDAVLVVPSGGAAYLVDGTSVQRHCDQLSFLAVRLEPHPARALQRNAEDRFELGHVAMPADGRASGIFRDHGLDDFYRM